MSKIRDLTNGLAAMKQLADLHRWYNRGYIIHLPGHALIYPPDYDKANSQQQLAFRAGYDDAKSGRTARSENQR
jgi:hypothetical protein